MNSYLFLIISPWVFIIIQAYFYFKLSTLLNKLLDRTTQMYIDSIKNNLKTIREYYEKLS